MALDLYLAVLDAGDRLTRALDAGDLDAAGAALTERADAIRRLGDGAPLPPPSHVTERARAQSERLRGALDAAGAALRAERAGVARAERAHRRYAAAPRGATTLDTERR